MLDRVKTLSALSAHSAVKGLGDGMKEGWNARRKEGWYKVSRCREVESEAEIGGCEEMGK